MNAAVLRLFLVSDPLELQQVLAFLLLEHVELLTDASLFVLKKLDLELINFLLFVFVDILKLRLLKSKLAVFILAERVSWDGRDSLAVLSDTLRLLFGFLLELFYLFFLLLNLP